MDQLSLFDNRETTSLLQQDPPRHPGRLCGAETPDRRRQVLRNLIEKDQVTSMIFWGLRELEKRPGQDYCRENTLLFHRFFRRDKRNKGNQNGNGAGGENRSMGIRTILFVDEIHRFNKAQQDAFLPMWKKGASF